MSKRIAIAAAAIVVVCGTFALRQTVGQQPNGLPLLYDGSDQKVSQLNAKITEDLQKYTDAKDEDAKRAAKTQLAANLGELFDLRQKEREEEIKEIETRVAKLRETLKKRADKRQELVEHHLTTLIQDAEGLGWGSDTGQGNAIYYQPMPPGGIRNFSTPRGGVRVLPVVPQAK